MALTATVSLDLLEKLEADLQAHKTGGETSVYQFAGYKNGAPVGITKTVNVSLNRGGQILQFLAGYFTATTDSAIKARIAKATAEVYNVFADRPIFTKYEAPPASEVANIQTNGHFPKDPSGAYMFLGLMMIDRQGVTAHSEFTKYCKSTTSYIRSTQLPRQALKAHRSCYYFNGEKTLIPNLLNGTPTVWATQKIPPEGLAGTVIMTSLLALYSKLYNVSTYNDAYQDASALLRKVTTHYSNSYDSAGNLLNTTYSGQHAGAVMVIPVGNPKHSRGAFPSVGYTSIVAMAYAIQAFAETATASSTFTNMNSLISNHPLRVDGLKVLNYYRDRVNADGELFQIGAHRNYAGDAKRFEADWRAYSKATNFEASGQFNNLLDINIYPGRSGYAYTMMAVNPTHSLFERLADKFAYSTGKKMPQINYEAVGSEASVAQAFASVDEAVSCRVVSGLGFAMVNGVTTIR